MYHRGHHVLLDYVIDVLPAADELASWLMDVLATAIRAQSINIVHQHCEVFDGSVSPPGFAAVLLLDESHCSAHCYSELGMLAIDVFSCGGAGACSKTTAVADAVDAVLRQRFAVTHGDRSACPRFPTTAAQV